MNVFGYFDQFYGHSPSVPSHFWSCSSPLDLCYRWFCCTNSSKSFLDSGKQQLGYKFFKQGAESNKFVKKRAESTNFSKRKPKVDFPATMFSHPQKTYVNCSFSPLFYMFIIFIFSYSYSCFF